MKYVGLLIAIIIAVGVMFTVFRMASKDEPPAPPPVANNVPNQPAPVQVTQQQAPEVETVDIYIAARDIPLGTKIDRNMLTTQPWPKHLMVQNFVSVPNGEQLINTVARAPFRRDEPINKSKLANPDDPNFIAGQLPAGQRMVTIETDVVAGVAGFVFPGDRVDVLITHEVLREGVTEEDIEEARNERELMEQVTETLLLNARVLAVDQRSTAGVDPEEGIVIPRTVSLEVTPENAQRLRLGEEIGQLSLALRSIEDKDTIETVAMSRLNDLSQSEGVITKSSSSPVIPLADDEDEEEFQIKVIRGTEVEVLGQEQ